MRPFFDVALLCDAWAARKIRRCCFLFFRKQIYFSTNRHPTENPFSSVDATGVETRKKKKKKKKVFFRVLTIFSNATTLASGGNLEVVLATICNNNNSKALSAHCRLGIFAAHVANDVFHRRDGAHDQAASEALWTKTQRHVVENHCAGARGHLLWPLWLCR
jgi:hypothetical protein